MERQWDRLSRAIASARRGKGMTQDEMAAALEVGRATIQKMESGHVYSKVQPVHRSAARVLGWSEKSVEQILSGGEPTLVEAGEALPAPGRGSELDEVLNDLSEHVRMALLGGKVVDGDVIDLASDDPDSVAVLILKRGNRPNVTPEQMRDDLRKWSKLQRAAREIFSEGPADQ